MVPGGGIIDVRLCDVALMVEIIATDLHDWQIRIIERLKNIEPKSAQA